ncbi:MAG: AAA family ATPase [Candidatus Acidifodinimicrobium sp.]
MWIMSSLYEIKRSIEQIISERPNHSKTIKEAVSKNFKLENILHTSIDAETEFLSLLDNYQTEDKYEGYEILSRVLKSLNYVKSQLSDKFGDVKTEVEHKNDETKFNFVDGKRYRLLTLLVYPSYKGETQATYFFKPILKEPELVVDIYKILNNEVAMDFVESKINNLVNEANAKEEGERVHVDADSGDGKKVVKRTIEEILASLGVEVYKGNVGLSDIGGYQEIKDRVKREIFVPFLYKDLLEAVKSANRMSISTDVDSALFYGPPGTGKTMMARAIANDEKVNFLYMNLSKIYSVWYSESSKRMEAAIDSAVRYSNEHGKTVLFIDEIDSLGSRTYTYSTESGKVLNTLLTKLSGISSQDNKNLLIIGCTNLLDNLDPALVSRFKTKIYFGMPDKSDRLDIISKYAKNLSREELESLSEKTQGFSGRDIESMASIAESNFAYDLANKNVTDSHGYNIKVDYYIKAAELTKRTKENDEKVRDMYR